MDTPIKKINKNLFKNLSKRLFFLIFFTNSVYAGTVLKFDRRNVDIRKEAIQRNLNLNSINNVKSNVADVADIESDFVVQFKTAITEKDKAFLLKEGMRIFRYIPEDALIVRATKKNLDKISQQYSSRINGFISFKGDIKISENFSENFSELFLGVSPYSQGQRENILISAFVPEDTNLILQKIQEFDPNLIVLDQTDRYLAVRIEKNLILKVLNFTGVEYVEKVRKMELFYMDLLERNSVGFASSVGDYSDLDGYETGTKLMNFDTAWLLGFQGQNQIVGIADTGFDSGDLNTIHSDLKEGIAKGYAFGVGSKSWNDPMGHGTHCAGSILGRGVISGGKLMGGAPAATLIAEGMWSTIIDNIVVPPKLATLLSAAYSDGARLHSNSWGNPRDLGVYDSMAQQADEFMWDNPDFLAIFAAGNSGVDKNKDGVIDSGSTSSPGTAKNVLTVGASENKTSLGGIQLQVKELRDANVKWSVEPIFSSKLSDNSNGLAMFSSRGPTRDGRIKPDVVAPGTNILSVRSQVTGASELWGAYNNFYTWSGGTSMATPLVAGAAAVTRQVLSEKFDIKNASAALVKAVLMHTAFDLYPGQYGEGASTQELKTHRPNSDEGYGRVDLEAISKLKEKSIVFDEKEGVATGEVFEKSVSVENGQKLIVTMIYTDAPGTQAAATALVNDLDLEIVLNDGSVNSSNDKLNNQEHIELANLTEGAIYIRVKGTNIPMGKSGKQPFALLISLL